MAEPTNPSVPPEVAAPPPALGGPDEPRGSLQQALDVLRAPHFARLWTSNLMQFICFQVLTLALMWLVTSLVESRAAITTISFVQAAIMMLASPWAGVVVDRHAKRNMIAVGRVGIAVISMSLALLVATGSVAYWQIVVAGIAGGLVASLINPATQTYVFDLVGRAGIERAVALNATGSSFGMIFGGALAGVLIGSIGLISTYAFASIGVLASAAIVLSIPARGEASQGAEASHLSDLREGFAYIRSRPPLLIAFVACSMAIFNGAISPMRPVFARHVLEVGAEGFGLLSASQGVGTMTAALAVTLRPPTRHLGVWMAVTMLGFATGIVLYALSPNLGFSMGVEVWLGITGQLWNVVAITGFQLAVPDQMRGRVVGMVFMLAHLGCLGMLGVGLLADVLGDRAALAIFGIIPSLVLVALLLVGGRKLAEM